MQHLYHFCATLPATLHAIRAPEFSFECHSPDEEKAYIVGSVVLPTSVDASVRFATGRFTWITEKMAKKDAAFEAYRALYLAGLIDANLLPLNYVDQDVDQAYAAVEQRPSVVEVSDMMNPWLAVAYEWQSSESVKGSTVQIIDGDEVCVGMMLLLPCNLPHVAEFDLAWNSNRTFKINIKENNHTFDPEIYSDATRSTSLVLKSIFRGRMNDRHDFMQLFVPCHTNGVGTWSEIHTGTTGADTLPTCDNQHAGLIRDMSRSGIPYFLHGVHHLSPLNALQTFHMDNQGRTDRKMLSDISSICEPLNNESCGGKETDLGTHVVDSTGYDHLIDSDLFKCLTVSKVPKKVDFLHKSSYQDVRIEKETKTIVLPASQCEVDKLPAKFALFAMFVPSIMHKIQVAMVRDHLCNGLLASLHFEDRDLVTTAICASSALEITNYQRFEFIGDSLLKYFTSLTLMANFPKYHEGILSHKKDHIVSNSSLAAAAMQLNLDRYIITKPFTGLKWRPLYCGDILAAQDIGKREMSSKTLADVVEALL